MTDDIENYYMKNKQKLLKDFNLFYKAARHVLIKQVDPSRVCELEQKSRTVFNELIPGIPYVGGKKNTSTRNITGSAIMLAIITPLEDDGMTTREIGKVIYDTYDCFFSSKPKFLMKIAGKVLLSGYYAKKARLRAAESQKRIYPYAFVTEYVPPEPNSFDMGQDTIECGICKYFKKLGKEKYLPYMCLGDFPLFRAMGLGLVRTCTLGHGDSKCDFRLVKGGGTTLGWPPEDLAEWG